MCNTFGGVVFIAILLAMLTRQDAAQNETAEPNAAPVEIESATRALLDLEKLKRESAHIESALDRRLGMDERQTHQVAEQAEKGEEQAQHATALRDEVKALAAAVERARSDALTTARKASDARQQLGTARAAAVRVEQEMAEQRRGKVRVLRLPEYRRVYGRQQFSVYLASGRLIPMTDRSGQWNTMVVDVTTSAAGDEFTVRVVRSAGPSLAGDLASNRDILAMLNGIDPKTHIVQMFVSTDAFADFIRFRDFIVARGFEHYWVPTATDTFSFRASDHAEGL
jgi:hypothetical protein